MEAIGSNVCSPPQQVSGNQAGCAAQVAACVGSAFPQLGAASSTSSSAASASAPAPSSTATGGSGDCQSTYKTCAAGGRSEELCSCDLAVCTGEDSARGRAYCASLSAGLATATGAAASGATGIATSGVARPTSAVGGAGSNSTSSTPIVTGAAASVGVSVLGAASAFVSYLLL